jgi:hypothetical protein
MEIGPELWLKLPNESEQAYIAWSLYRDMEPPRSIRKLAERCSKSVSLLLRWSARWRWQKRLEAYLRNREETRLRELEKTIKKMKERHIGIAQMLQGKALERLQEIDPKQLSPDAIVRFLDLAVTLERKSLDIETPVKQVNTTNITELTLSETRELRSPLQESVQRLAPVSRDLIRQLTTKTLKLLELQTGLHADGDTTITVPGSSDSAAGDDEGRQPTGDGEDKPPAGAADDESE